MGLLSPEWKHSIVQPDFKYGKNPNESHSYRPISLTSTLCKINGEINKYASIVLFRKNKLLSNV